MKFAAIGALIALLAVPAGAAGMFDDDECRHTAPRNASTPAAGISRVVIHGEAGSLKVDGVQNAPQIAVTGKACTSEDDFLERMTLTLRKSGSTLHIEARIPDKTVIFGFFSARLDFAVTLPAGLPVEIEDGSGLIQLANTGATTIEDGSGAIEVRGVRGRLEVSDGSGSIDIDGVSGPVSIEDGSGEILVRNVGAIEIEDGSGSISIAHADGAVRIREDGSGSIVVRSARGEVTIDEDGSGSIHVTDVGGDFVVGRKGSGHITHDRVAGKLSLPREH
jgi:hypothetical protein